MRPNLFQSLYIDYRRFIIEERSSFIQVIFFTQGFGAIFIYRLMNSVAANLKPRFLRNLLLAVLYPIRKLIEVVSGIYLPYHCSVGKGLYISHFGNIIINKNAIIGDYCNLSQGVTIGVKHGGKNPGVPTLKNRVYVGPNAILIGGIEIGDDAAIGAGAIVTKSVPPRGVAVGNPARVISYNGSFSYVHYDGMDSDPERCESIVQMQKQLTMKGDLA